VRNSSTMIVIKIAITPSLKVSSRAFDTARAYRRRPTAQPFAYCSAVRESNSKPTTASSPTTQAS